MGLGWFALDRYHQAALAREALARAIIEQTRARVVLQEAQGALDRLTHDLGDLQARIDEANHRLIADRTEIERRATNDMLGKLRRRAAEIEDQRRRRAEELEHLRRTAPVTVSDDCLHNALCK
jgi:predicted  nucleic acid-binding Zn-ribbon protein